ncbi:hypothetical protein BKA56DRAFT_577570 [Ilyonectria sp. MPI-CAGE-AT-0026]|nr:hypothetical protein BKA56DRAFT_577570 [Ilyonectria sp. MPI-CAGE-AT-0026]
MRNSMSTSRRMLWERFRGKAAETDTTAERFAERGVNPNDDPSISSQDSGYGSVESTTHSDGCLAIKSPDSLSIQPDMNMVSALGHQDSYAGISTSAEEASTRSDTANDNNTKAPHPATAPTSKPAINAETHRVVREIVSAFKKNFGGPLLHHLNSRKKTSKGLSTHAVAIFPKLAWSETGRSIEVDIIVQCHPSVESHVQQFMKDNHEAVETSFQFAQQHLCVKTRVVGREINFLSFAYWPESGKRDDRLKVCGNLMLVEKASSGFAKCTLGGMLSIGALDDSSISWFGVTTAHGLHSSLESGELPTETAQVNLSTPALTCQVLELIDKVCLSIDQQVGDDAEQQVRPDNYASDALGIIQNCKTITKRLARLTVQGDLRRNLRYAIQYKVRHALESCLSELESMLGRYPTASMQLSQSKYYPLRALKDVETSLSAGLDSATAESIVPSAFSAQLDKSFSLTDFFGEVYVTSSEQTDVPEQGFSNQRNLDWALIQSFEPDGIGEITGIKSGLLQPSNRGDFGVFEPSSSVSDVDTSRRVMIINERQGYPEAEISFQVAFICVPPSSELVEVLVYTTSAPPCLPPKIGQQEFVPGDSGSWAVSINELGDKRVHGQLIGTNCLGEGLLMPMDKILDDIAAKLQPMLGDVLPTIKLHLPLIPLNLDLFSKSDQPDLQIRGMPKEGHFVAWNLMRLSWETARAQWRILAQPHDGQEKEQWKEEKREWEDQFEEWRVAPHSSPSISIEWFKKWERRQRLWAISLRYWTLRKQSSPINDQYFHQDLMEIIREEENASLIESTHGLDSLSRPLGSLGQSHSSKATSSYQSLWSHAASLATASSSVFDNSEPILNKAEGKHIVSPSLGSMAKASTPFATPSHRQQTSPSDRDNSDQNNPFGSSISYTPELLALMEEWEHSWVTNDDTKINPRSNSDMNVNGGLYKR